MKRTPKPTGAMRSRSAPSRSFLCRLRRLESSYATMERGLPPLVLRDPWGLRVLPVRQELMALMERPALLVPLARRVLMALTAQMALRVLLGLQVLRDRLDPRARQARPARTG